MRVTELRVGTVRVSIHRDLFGDRPSVRNQTLHATGDGRQEASSWLINPRRTDHPRSKPHNEVIPLSSQPGPSMTDVEHLASDLQPQSTRRVWNPCTRKFIGDLRDLLEWQHLDSPARLAAQFG